MASSQSTLALSSLYKIPVPLAAIEASSFLMMKENPFYYLPKYLIIEILLNYLYYNDRIEFILGNHYFYDKLFKDSIRIIDLNQSFFIYSSSDITGNLIRQKLQSIRYPYKQLNITLNNHSLEPNDVFPNIQFIHSIYRLITTSELLFYHFLPHIQSIYCLDIESSEVIIDMNQILQEIAIKNLHHHFGLQELILRNIPFLHVLPPIPQLTKLSLHNVPLITKLPLMKTMKFLELINCPDIKDITACDHIYDIQLIDCPKISSIETLQHNHKVLINNCLSILDYSNSFRYTVSLTVLSPNPLSHINTLNYITLKHFHLYYWKSKLITNDLFLNHMKSLSLQKFQSFTISNHIPTLYLWKLQLIDCTSIKSVIAFGHITVLHLEQLPNLHNLVGLGFSNKVVHIISCNEIVDFSPLKHVPKVSIIRCVGFRDGYDVDHVKHLIIEEFSFHDTSMLGISVEYLELRNCPNLISFVGLKRTPILDLSGMNSYLTIEDIVGEHEKLVIPALWIKYNSKAREKLLDHYTSKIEGIENQEDIMKRMKDEDSFVLLKKKVKDRE